MRNKPSIFAEADIERTIRLYPSYRQIFVYPTGKKEFISYKEAIEKNKKNGGELSMIDHTLVANVDTQNEEIKIYMIPIVESA
jgi:hypothetical protein